MRWVLDTNVVASGLLWNGASAALLVAAQRHGIG
jgi:predicted nucleic acid-binding protein